MQSTNHLQVLPTFSLYIHEASCRIVRSASFDPCIYPQIYPAGAAHASTFQNALSGCASSAPTDRSFLHI